MEVLTFEKIESFKAGQNPTSCLFNHSKASFAFEKFKFTTLYSLLSRLLVEFAFLISSEPAFEQDATSDAGSSWSCYGTDPLFVG